jgi:hypothetical protein
MTAMIGAKLCKGIIIRCDQSSLMQSSQDSNYLCGMECVNAIDFMTLMLERHPLRPPSVLWWCSVRSSSDILARGHDEIMVVAAATRYARNGGDHNDELG